MGGAKIELKVICGLIRITIDDRATIEFDFDWPDDKSFEDLDFVRAKYTHTSFPDIRTPSVDPDQFDPDWFSRAAAAAAPPYFSGFKVVTWFDKLEIEEDGDLLRLSDSKYPNTDEFRDRKSILIRLPAKTTWSDAIEQVKSHWRYVFSS